MLLSKYESAKTIKEDEIIFPLATHQRFLFYLLEEFLTDYGYREYEKFRYFVQFYFIEESSVVIT
jgi:hypothetical protein